MDLLSELANSAHLLGITIGKLEKAQIDPTIPAEQRSAIILALPRLRLRRRELDAEFEALCALPPSTLTPSAEAQQQIKSATAALAQQTSQALQVELLVTTVTNLVNAVRSAKPG